MFSTVTYYHLSSLCYCCPNFSFQFFSESTFFFSSLGCFVCERLPLKLVAFNLSHSVLTYIPISKVNLFIAKYTIKILTKQFATFHMLGSTLPFQKLFQSLPLLCISELNVLYCKQLIIVAHFKKSVIEILMSPRLN